MKKNTNSSPILEENQIVDYDTLVDETQENTEERLLVEEKRKYLIPTLLPNPLHPEKDRLKEALETPYMAMDAEDKLNLIGALPWSSKQVPTNLANLFFLQSNSLKEGEKKLIQEVKSLRHQMSELSQTDLSTLVSEEEIEKTKTADEKFLKSLAKLDNLTPHNHNLPADLPFSQQANGEQTLSGELTGELSEELTGELTEELSGELTGEQAPTSDSIVPTPAKIEDEIKVETEVEVEAIKGHKVVEIDQANIKTKGFFRSLFSNLFDFGIKTLQNDIGVLHGREKSRLLFGELALLIAMIELILFFTVLPYFLASLSKYSLYSLYQFIFPQLMLNVVILAVPFILLSQTQSLQYKRLFGKMELSLVQLVILSLAAFPVSVFIKSLNNILFYFLSYQGIYFETLNFPSFRAFLLNQNQAETTLIAYIFGLILPVLMQGLFFRGLIEGHMLARGYRISAVLVPSLANAFYEVQPDYIFASFLFAVFASYVRLQTGSLNISIMLHAMAYFIYHNSNDLFELLRINTDWVESLTGLNILKQSFIALFFTSLLLLIIYRYFKSFRRQDLLLKVIKQGKTKALPLSFLFIIAALISIFLKVYLYF